MCVKQVPRYSQHRILGKCARYVPADTSLTARAVMEWTVLSKQQQFGAAVVHSASAFHRYCTRVPEYNIVRYLSLPSGQNTHLWYVLIPPTVQVATRPS